MSAVPNESAPRTERLRRTGSAICRGFDLIPTAPNGISALRELILGMALRGALSESVASAAEGSKTGEDGVQPALLSKFKLPTGWRWVTVEQLCALKTGATPSTAKREYYGGEVKWLVSGDIHKSEIYDCAGRITERAIASSNCKILPANSVLIALNGQGKTRATVAILRVPAACNQSLVAMTPKDTSVITPEFLFWNLRYRYREIRDITGQKQRRGLNMKLVSELPIAVAPIDEQRRIVGRVEELMRLCDALEVKGRLAAEQHARLLTAMLATLTDSRSPAELTENWQRLDEHFDLLLDRAEAIGMLEACITDLALQGRLVEPGAEGVSAEDEVRAMASEIAKYRKEHRVPRVHTDPVNVAGVPYELPRDWRWVRLDSLFRVITDGDHLPPPKSESGVAFLTIGNISSGEISFDGCRYVPDEYFQSIAPYRRPIKGDLLYTVVGATYGRPVVVRSERQFCVQRHIAILKPAVAGTDINFLRLVLQSSLVYQQATRGITGTAQPTVPLSALRNFLVPLPSLAEQHRIVARVAQFRRLCAGLRQRIIAQETAQSRLAEALAESVTAAS